MGSREAQTGVRHHTGFLGLCWWEQCQVLEGWKASVRGPCLVRSGLPRSQRGCIWGCGGDPTPPAKLGRLPGGQELSLEGQGMLTEQWRRWGGSCVPWAEVVSGGLGSPKARVEF